MSRRSSAGRRTSRRRLLRGIAAGAGLVLVARLAAGGDQAARGDARLAGHPEFLVRIGAQRIETPANIAAGRTLVIQENRVGERGHSLLLRFPDEITEDEIAKELSPETATEEGPPWFFDALFLGMTDRAAPDGGRAVGLVDLVPGRWVAGSVFRVPWEWGRSEITAAPSTQPATDPTADVVAGMREMAFDMPTAVPAGPRLWKVENTGAMHHEIVILPVPAEATAGTQGADALAPFGPAWAGWQAEPVAGIGMTSPQRTAWGQFDLEPGTYAAVCFIPDVNQPTFIFHLTEGMTRVFTVA